MLSNHFANKHSLPVLAPSELPPPAFLYSDTFTYTNKNAIP